MHVQAEPRPLALRPDLPPELCAIVHKMMAKKPEARYQSAREMLNDLARFLSGAGPMAPVSASVFFPATGNSSTHVPAMTSGQYATQPMPTPGGAGRYAVVALLAVAAAAGGAALHLATSPPRRTSSRRTPWPTWTRTRTTCGSATCGSYSAIRTRSRKWPSSASSNWPS